MVKKKKKNIPELRFPGFEGEWEEKKLIELCDKISDGIHSTPVYDDNGDIFFINGNNLVDGRIIINSNTRRVSAAEYNKYKVFLGKYSILMSINGTIGNLAYYNNERVILGKSACYINLLPSIDKKIIYYILQNPAVLNYYNAELTGSTIKNLSLSSIKSTVVNIPSLPEQEKIASFLSAVDERIQQLSKKKSFLEQYKKGVMQQIFSQKLRFKDDKGNNFPDWEEIALDNILIKNSLKNKNKQYSLVQSVSNRHGFVNQDDYFEERVIASKDLSNYYIIEKGFFAYNPSRINVGSLAYKSDDITSVVSPLYISFKANSIYLKDIFLLNWFFSSDFIRQMNCSFEGSVRNTLSYESLKSMVIKLPCLPEQEKIASFLTSIDIKIKLVNTQLEKTKAWKKGLLQKMFV